MVVRLQHCIDSSSNTTAPFPIRMNATQPQQVPTSPSENYGSWVSVDCKMVSSCSCCCAGTFLSSRSLVWIFPQFGGWGEQRKLLENFQTSRYSNQHISNHHKIRVNCTSTKQYISPQQTHYPQNNIFLVELPVLELNPLKKYPVQNGTGKSYLNHSSHTIYLHNKGPSLTDGDLTKHNLEFTWQHTNSQQTLSEIWVGHTAWMSSGR
jgi:hypothetical protein